MIDNKHFKFHFLEYYLHRSYTKITWPGFYEKIEIITTS